jgi:hypothetical protein
MIHELLGPVDGSGEATAGAIDQRITVLQLRSRRDDDLILGTNPLDDLDPIRRFCPRFHIHEFRDPRLLRRKWSVSFWQACTENHPA